MKKFFIKLLTEHLFKWVTEEDILSITKDGILHKGKYLNKDQTLKLSEQAHGIKGMYLWKVLQAELVYTAYLMFTQARDYNETLSARLLLRAEEIIRKKLDALDSLIEK